MTSKCTKTHFNMEELPLSLILVSILDLSRSSKRVYRAGAGRSLNISSETWSRAEWPWIIPPSVEFWEGRCPQPAWSVSWARGSKACGWTVILTLMVSLVRTNNSWALLAMQKFLHNRTQITTHKDFQRVLERSKHPPDHIIQLSSHKWATRDP